MGIILKREATKEAVKEAEATLTEGFDSSDYAFATRKIGVDLLVSSGSTLLDLAISGKRRRGGGIPGGMLMEMFGGEGSGKTALLAEICASAQSKDGEVRFLDPEARLDKEYSRIYEMNLKAQDYFRPETVSEVFDRIKDFKPKNTNVINVIGTDSLAALSTELEMEKGDKMGMKRAKEFSEGFRKLARTIASKNMLLACTNQTRQGEYGDVTPGGRAVAFYSSLRLRTTQKGLVYVEKDFQGKKVKKAIGIESNIFVKKSTIDDPYRECLIYIIFGYGIDDIRGNLQYMKDMRGETKYICPGEKSYVSMAKAIEYVEKEGLEEQLRTQTIDLWEEVEHKFDQNRKKKKR
jgi:recombination protein RecA